MNFIGGALKNILRNCLHLRSHPVMFEFSTTAWIPHALNYPRKAHAPHCILGFAPSFHVPNTELTRGPRHPHDPNNPRSLLGNHTILFTCLNDMQHVHHEMSVLLFNDKTVDIV